MTGRHAVFRVDLESQGHTALVLVGDGPRGKMSCAFVVAVDEEIPNGVRITYQSSVSWREVHGFSSNKI